MVTLTRSHAQAEYFVVSTILAKQYQTRAAAAFTVTPNTGVVSAG